MKREEALEYMNRYLDHDLNAEETAELFRHLGESPEAQADFDFLQSLSDQLESLPDVKPPISLVDSILPRLDEIDRMTPVAPAEPKPEQPPVILPGGQTAPRRRAAAFWRSTLGRTVGGTAVAAAVLGIFVATYQPEEMPNAEVTSTTAVSNATDDTLISSGAADSGAAPDLTDPSTEVQEIQPEVQPEAEDGAMQRSLEAPAEESDAADAQGGADGNDAATPDSSDSSSTPAESDSSSNAAQGGGSAKPKTNNGGTPTDTQKTDTPNKKTTPNATTPSGDTQRSAPPAVQSTPESGATADEGQPNEGISTFSIDGDEESSDAAAGAPESALPDSDAADAAPEGQMYMMVAPSEWTSPDGTYVITYSANALTLLKGDRSAELSTLQVDGDATNGVWSADGKTFTYDLVKPDGTITPETWKIEEVTLQPGGK